MSEGEKCENYAKKECECFPSMAFLSSHDVRCKGPACLLRKRGEKKGRKIDEDEHSAFFFSTSINERKIVY